MPLDPTARTRQTYDRIAAEYLPRRCDRTGVQAQLER